MQKQTPPKRSLGVSYFTPSYISLVTNWRSGPPIPSAPWWPMPRPNAARGDDPWFAPNSEVREALAEAVEAAHGSFKILVAWNFFLTKKNGQVILGKLLAKIGVGWWGDVGLRCCFNWGLVYY